MIKYQLICNQAHEFEGWFQTSQAFDKQNASGLVACPICNTVDVRRALMAPNLASPKRRQAAFDAAQIAEASEQESSIAGSTKTPAGKILSGTTGKQSQVDAPNEAQLAAFGDAIAKLRDIQRKIKDECRYVGDNFAEEARKIHYGESDPESIYGQTSVEECRELAEEGINVASMPWLPPEH